MAAVIAAGSPRASDAELRHGPGPHEQSGTMINDPIQPRAEQILLPGLLSLPRPHRSPSLDHLEGKESQPPKFEGIAKTIFVGRNY
jgi:hypothetical protein